MEKDSTIVFFPVLLFLTPCIRIHQQKQRACCIKYAGKQKKLRSKIKTELTLTGIAELKENRERVVVEIMKLAKNRHDDLLKGAH